MDGPHVPSAIPLTFLGTGNAFAPGRYWNSFLVGERVLVEPSPSVLPNLRRAGVDLAAIDVVFISHFHADHTFGWPFLLLEYAARTRRRSPLWVVGPPGVEARLTEMLRVGAYPDHARAAAVGGFALHFVEVNEQEQQAGSVCYRAERVEHEPSLECYGFVIQHEGRTVGYSGDTRLCDGLRRIAAASDVLALECAGRHDNAIHMSLPSVRSLRAEFPRLPFVLTHVDDEVDDGGIPDVRVAGDLETLHV
jgi:ribonuclease BN (tRNA processing enzyme)